MSQQELQSIEQALGSVDQEIHELRQNLQNAQSRREGLVRKKTELEQRIQQEQTEEAAKQTPAAAAPAPAAVAATPAGGETPAELQARIAELQRQIAEAETQKKTARPRSKSPSRKLIAKVSDNSGSPRPVTRKAVSQARVVAANDENSPPPESAPSEKKGGWRLFGRSKKACNDDAAAAAAATEPEPEADPVETVESPAEEAPTPVAEPAAEAPPAAAPVATAEIGSRVKLDWERPGWAHAMNKQDDGRAVDSDAIVNPNLQVGQDTGYRRQVFAKELEIDKGQFKTRSARAPDPRLAWIVLRINNKAVPGKIVMHLYGKDLQGLVDQFLGLKDTPLAVGGPNRASLTVQSEPSLYITTLSAKGLESKPGAYGVVQEGHDIVNKAIGAGDGANITIKQAHIFPVKKSKGGL